jgi:hypothetical protein
LTRATDLIGRLGNAVEFSVALDLDTNEDEVVDSKIWSRATSIDRVAMSLTTIFDYDYESKNFTGKVYMAASVLDAFEDGGARVGERSRRSWPGSIEGKVEWKFQFAAHGRDTTNNVSAVNGTAIPSMSGNHGGFDPNQMSTTTRAGNSDGLVKTLEEAFDTDGFVVAAGGGMEADAEELTGSTKHAAEGAASIHDDEATLSTKSLGKEGEQACGHGCRALEH